MNRECQDIEPLLEQYLDGDLQGRRFESVCAHLQHCSACRAVVQQERLLRDSLSALPPLACPPSVTTGIDRATRALRPERRTPFRWRPLGTAWGWKTVPAAAAVLALAALLFFSPSNRRSAGIDAPYSPSEIAEARQKAKLSLALALQIVNRSEREAVAEVLGKQFPRTVRHSLRKVISPPEGGQG